MPVSDAFVHRELSTTRSERSPSQESASTVATTWPSASSAVTTSGAASGTFDASATASSCASDMAKTVDAVVFP